MGGIPIVKYRERIACAVCTETADQMQERYALWSRVGQRNDVLGSVLLSSVLGLGLEAPRGPV